MFDCGDSQKEAIRPDFNRAIMIDFQGASISSDTGFKRNHGSIYEKRE